MLVNLNLDDQTKQKVIDHFNESKIKVLQTIMLNEEKSYEREITLDDTI